MGFIVKKIFVISMLGLASGAVTAQYYLKNKAAKIELAEVKEVKPHNDFMTANAIPLEPNKPVQIAVHDPALDTTEADILIEDRLLSNLSEDVGIRKIAEVSNVQCQGIECTVAVEAKDPEDSGVQMAVLKFLQAHPEFGNSFTIDDSKDDKRVTLFTFVRGSVEK
jgi:hypothetical protein